MTMGWIGARWGRVAASFWAVALALLPAAAETPTSDKMFAIAVEVYAVPSTTKVRYTASRVTVVKGSPGSVSDAAVGCVSGSGFQNQMKSLVRSGKAMAITTQEISNLSGSVFRAASGGKTPATEAPPAKWVVDVEGTLDARGTSTLVNFDVKVQMGGKKKWLVNGSQLVGRNQSLLIGSQLADSQPQASEHRIVIVIRLSDRDDKPAATHRGS